MYLLVIDEAIVYCMAGHCLIPAKDRAKLKTGTMKVRRKRKAAFVCVQLRVNHLFVLCWLLLLCKNAHVCFFITAIFL